MANWMFEPPVSTPISRMMASDASRIRWYSLSVSVCAGATVIESPVCTPIGSKFSIEQMMTTLSATSRITSISYSFQPMIDSSISTSLTGLSCEAAGRPARRILRGCRRCRRRVPPMVKLGRITHGRPISCDDAPGFGQDVHRAAPRHTSRPILLIASLNCWRSSALSITSARAPIISTPYFSSTPCCGQIHRQVRGRSARRAWAAGRRAVRPR